MKNGKGESGLMRHIRLQIMLSPEELGAVDSLRFKHRMPSRATAVVNCYGTESPPWGQ